MKLIQYLCDTGFTQFEAQGIILSGKVTINNNINTSIPSLPLNTQIIIKKI